MGAAAAVAIGRAFNRAPPAPRRSTRSLSSLSPGILFAHGIVLSNARVDQPPPNIAPEAQDGDLPVRTWASSSS